jgi:hypothetical protein
MRCSISRRGVFAVLCVVAAAAAMPAAAQQVAGYGTMAPGTLANAMMSAIAKVASQKENVAGVVQTHAGPTQYLPLLDRGELDFANANALDAHLAKLGTESFTVPNPNIRMVTVIFPLRQAILVRKDSPIKSLADLKGKRLAGEYQGQRTLAILLDSVLATAGMTTKDVQIVPAPNVLRGLDELGRGAADGALAALEMPKVKELQSQMSGGVRFIPLPDTPQGLAAMQKIAPPTYISEVKPSAAQAGIDEPTGVQAYDYVLLTRANEPDEIVYKVVKAMYENKPDLEAVIPGFREFAPDKMAKKSTVEYHPGAIKFYTEKGVWPPKG